MTKQWNLYEAKIKELYAENTLSVSIGNCFKSPVVVFGGIQRTQAKTRAFMSSVRAYRGRLIRWGVRKYNCRKNSDLGGGGGNNSSQDGGFSSGSDIASPTMIAVAGAEINPGRRGLEMGRRLGEGYLAMPGRMDQQHFGFGLADNSHYAHIYNTDSLYDTKPKPKVLVSPLPLQPSPPGHGNAMSYNAWDHPPPPPRKLSGDGSSSGFDHGSGNHGDVMAPPSYFGNYHHGAAAVSSSNNNNNNPYPSPPAGAAYDTAGNHHDHSGGSGLCYYEAPPPLAPQQHHHQRGRGGVNTGALGHMSPELSYAPAVRSFGTGGWHLSRMKGI
ncbi:hypothetical protein M426DRAFT_28257 [Hypoxylon sp. CI-4A]|nr:hypothetical protein M426DRAFT_28257 [Hypoxylon sp. CI-4A]